MRHVDEQTEAPQATVSRLILNALAVNLVLVSALLAAGMIFAVELALATVVALGFSVLTWACAALVLIPVWLISPDRRSEQDPAAEPLRGFWIDE